VTRLEHVANSDFARCSYTEGIELLQKAVADGRKFEDMVRAVRSSWYYACCCLWIRLHFAGGLNWYFGIVKRVKVLNTPCRRLVCGCDGVMAVHDECPHTLSES